MPLIIRPGGYSREEIIAADPLGASLVFWDEITQADVAGLREALENAQREQDLQEWLEAHPLVLAQHLHAGNGRWVIPRQRLGSEHVTDFVIGELDSFGYHWTAVELESPIASVFNKNGDPAAALVHAIRQVQDWRMWLTANRDYAIRAKAENGLNLTDIDGNVPGLIFIGRRRDLDDSTRLRRRQMSQDTGITIHTYDWLVDEAQARANVNDPLVAEEGPPAP